MARVRGRRPLHDDPERARAFRSAVWDIAIDPSWNRTARDADPDVADPELTTLLEGCYPFVGDRDVRAGDVPRALDLVERTEYETSRALVAAVGLADGTALVLVRRADEWRHVTTRCRTCGLPAVCPDETNPAYCSAAGRTRLRSVAEQLRVMCVLNALWATQCLMRAPRGTLQYHAPGSSDKLLDYAFALRMPGIDLPETHRRQAVYGERVGVFALVDGSEVIQVGTGAEDGATAWVQFRCDGDTCVERVSALLASHRGAADRHAEKAGSMQTDAMEMSRVPRARSTPRSRKRRAGEAVVH